MVGRLIQNQAVGTADHHLRKQAAYLFSTGENLYLLDTILTGKEHTSQEAAHIGGILDGRVAGQPVSNRQVIIELCCVILGEISLGSGNTPLVSTFIRLHFSGQNLEQRSLCQFISAYKCNLIIMPHNEREVIQNLFSIDGFRQMFHG